MFGKIVLAALLGIVGTTAFASTASAHERDIGRMEVRGEAGCGEGLYGNGNERFERREAFEHLRRHPRSEFRQREMQLERNRGW